MTLLEEIRAKRKAILASAIEHGVTSVRIVGSASKGTDTPESDIDFLIDLAEGRTLLDWIGFMIDMEDLFQRKIDVFTEDSLHRLIRQEVVASAVPL